LNNGLSHVNRWLIIIAISFKKFVNNKVVLDIYITYLNNFIINLYHKKMATVDTIHSHGYQHFESLQLSAQEFYDTLENMIKEYQYPNVQCKNEELKEGGMFSAKRKYFSIYWKRHQYLVCASPFGKSFFISWWHREGASTGEKFASLFGPVGKFIANKMENKTLFEVDAQLMFINCISSIVQIAINKVKIDKGYTVEDQSLLN